MATFTIDDPERMIYIQMTIEEARQLLEWVDTHSYQHVRPPIVNQIREIARAVATGTHPDDKMVRG